MRKTRVFPPSNLKKTLQMAFFTTNYKRPVFFVPALCNICLLSKTSQKKETSGWITAFLVVILGYQRPSPKTIYLYLYVYYCVFNNEYILEIEFGNHVKEIVTWPHLSSGMKYRVDIRTYVCFEKKKGKLVRWMMIRRGFYSELKIFFPSWFGGVVKFFQVSRHMTQYQHCH